jgi:anti-sigma factor (TIGR02949 family)
MSSASVKAIDDCARFSAWVAPYVDGELDADHAVEMEAHVVGCATCAERVALIRAVRTSLKHAARKERAPEALAARVRAGIEQERRRAASQRADVAGGRGDAPLGDHQLIRLRYAVGLAAAAGVVFAMGLSRVAHRQMPVGDMYPGLASPDPQGDTASRMSIDGLLDELVALHARPFPPDTTDPDQLPRFDPILGVQVRRPTFRPFGASFTGARVHPVSDRGALLQVQYTVDGGKRMTMYVFNPRVLPVQATRLQQRVVRHHPMFVGRLRGYSVAALEQSGVGYAFASDLDSDESTRMVVDTLANQ